LQGLITFKFLYDFFDNMFPASVLVLNDKANHIFLLPEHSKSF
jgi:hypothetical protein